MRVAALPILALPERCHSLSLTETKDWHHRREAMAAADGIILNKAHDVWAWGSRAVLRSAFGNDLDVYRRCTEPSEADVCPGGTAPGSKRRRRTVLAQGSNQSEAAIEVRLTRPWPCWWLVAGGRRPTIPVQLAVHASSTA